MLSSALHISVNKEEEGKRITYMDINIDNDLYNVGKIEFVPRYKIYLFFSEIKFQCKKSWYLWLIITIDENMVTFKEINKCQIFYVP